MIRRSLEIAIVTSMLLTASCGTHSVATMGSLDSSDSALPQVFQRGGMPSDWLMTRDDSFGDADDDQMTVDPNGKVWFTESCCGSLAFIDMYRNGGSVFLGPGSAPIGIALGPDRKIWYADETGYVGKLTSLNSQSTVIKYPVSGYRPERIVKGPDGNMWVTATGPRNERSAIVRITPTGSTTTYPVPTISQLNGLTVGPDGNIWFCEAEKIGKLAISTGTITEYSVAPSFKFPFDIAADANNLYFTGASNLIGMMTTGGVFSTLNDTSEPAFGSAYDLANGPDGHVWVIGENPGQARWVLARIGAHGFENYQDPNACCDFGLIDPGGIIGGPDGNVWFLAEGAGVPRGHGPPPLVGRINVFVRRVMKVSPSSLHFTAAGQAQDVVVSESRYTGGWTATSTNNAVASVSPEGSPNMFSVESVGAGSALISIQDGAKNIADVTVTVGQR